MPEENESAKGVPEKTSNPAIRTMKTDIDALFRTRKPTISQMIGKAEESVSLSRFEESRRRRVFFLILTGASILALAAGVFVFFFAPSLNPFSPKESVPAASPSASPPTFFSVDATRQIAGDTANRPSLLRAVETAVLEKQQDKSITALNILLRDGPNERVAALDDFFGIYRIEAPLELLNWLEGLPMIFILHTDAGSRLGIAIKAKDADRALSTMLVWELTLPLEFNPLFFNEPAETTARAFEDRSYRNIDIRFLPLSKEKDIGIGYALFPAGNIVVITTSEGALHAAIDRLFATH